ncbi:CDP-diacylglycerol--serine O-phosphatidyltransferase [Thalassotalea sediminis]|uniref:CDP-diacylglycerol--serine O-phosphatidyltransferase n=1 Tax=Thalassotalea sediminis TaxID=1759089 RepID=UPI0025748D24|nr:CDP-diacylglycerol--serine O-phosphatidyltransferase [Thalassotalea sediminis]
MHVNAIGIKQQDLEIITSSKAFAQRLAALIQRAKKRIVISSLYLQDDDAGRAIMTLLVDAKQQNPALSISILLDDHRARRGRIGEKSSAGNQAYYQQLCQEHNVDIGFYGVRVKARELMGVMHLKGMMFDNVVLYSGASINNDYLHQGEKYRLDRYYQIDNQHLADSMCRLLLDELVASNTVTSLLSATLPSKKQLKGLCQRTFNTLKNTQYQFVASTVEEGISATPILGCGYRKNALNKISLSLIKASSTSIVLITPYFNLPKPVIKALVKAMKRGVEVNIIVGDKSANDFFISDDEAFSTIGIIPYLYEKILKRFLIKFDSYLSKGLLNVHLWRDQENSFHAKGMIVDDIYHLVTGSNMNPRAWTLDLENAILLQDHQQIIKEDVDQELAIIMANTTKVTHANMIDDVRDYPEKPKKLIKKLSLSKVDRLLKRFL